MKKNYFKCALAAVAFVVPCAGALAADFSVGGLYYDILSEADRTCAVVYEDGAVYEGDIVVPAQVEHDGTAYTVTEIGNTVFYGSSITSVSLPGTVTVIGNGAFMYCESLKSVDMPSVAVIDDHAFNSCTSLNTIDLPGTLTTIGWNAFNSSGLESITIPNSVTEIGNGAFMSCESLKSVVLSNSLATISNVLFYNCISLESIVIPNSVTEICQGAFNFCDNLREVTIGSSVTSIEGPTLFSLCDNLETITILATTPPAGMDGIGMTSSQYSKITLRVPAGSLDAYSSAPGWGEFDEIVEFTPTGITAVSPEEGMTVKAGNGSIFVDGADGRVAVYDVSGALVKSVDAGGSVEIAVPSGRVYIVKAAGQTVKVAM